MSLKLCNGKIFTYIGEVQGKITWPPKGDNGFGYDPYFIPEQSEKTFAEMQSDEKLKASHRFQAFKILSSQI